MKQVLLKNEDEEDIVELRAEEGKCLVNAKGHRFVHNVTGKGLPIWCYPNEVSIYHEENL